MKNGCRTSTKSLKWSWCHRLKNSLRVSCIHLRWAPPNQLRHVPHRLPVNPVPRGSSPVMCLFLLLPSGHHIITRGGPPPPTHSPHTHHTPLRRCLSPRFSRSPLYVIAWLSGFPLPHGGNEPALMMTDYMPLQNVRKTYVCTTSHSHPLYLPTVKGMRRNSSVPDLSDIEKLSVPDTKSISESTSKLSVWYVCTIMTMNYWLVYATSNKASSLLQIIYIWIINSALLTGIVIIYDFCGKDFDKHIIIGIACIWTLSVYVHTHTHCVYIRS